MPLKFLPDLDVTTPEVLTDVSNAAPSILGYEGFPTGVDLGVAAASENVTGAALSFRLDGSAVLFIGTDDTLQKAGTSTWEDLTDSSYATGYSVGTERWRFVAYGDTTIAANKAVILQSYNYANDFDEVENSPKARYMETASGFVMLADCNDTDTGLSTAYGDQGHRWWCSQIFNPTGTWAPDVSTQATTGLLVDSPGPITGLRRLGGDIVAFKKSAVHVGRYVGPPVVWQWARIPGDVGCNVQEAAVSIGNRILFIGDEDIYSFDGTVPIPIGLGIKEWFFAEELNKTYASSITGVHDQANARVMWWYPSGSDGTLNSVLIYNYEAQSWGHAEVTIQAIAFAQVSGVTYDGFGAAMVALSGQADAEYDEIPQINYESPYFQAGAPIVSYIGTDKKVYLLSGTPGTWSITTGDIGDPDGFSLLRKVKPKWRTRPTTSTLVHRHRNDPGDAHTEEAAVSLDTDRFHTLRSARWHSYRLTCTGTGEIEAFRPDLVPQGTE